MMLVGLLFLLLLTGGNISSADQSALHDDQQVSNQSFVEMTGGNTSSSEQPKLLDDKQVFNQSFEQGGNTSNTEQYTSNFFKEENRINESCSYNALLKYLKLTKNNELYTLSRPVRSPEYTTPVFLKMVLYAILDVRETDQTFISYVWIYMSWKNDHIYWDPDEFCQTDHVNVPSDLLWKPDLTIEEMTERDKAPPSPYLTVNSDGRVELRNDQMVTSTCRMQVYKFPFDIQMCSLSFKSVVHSEDEIQLYAILNSSKITEWSYQVIKKQNEWLLVNISAHQKTVNYFQFNQSMVVYTISMKRRSVIYIINFILPILFFLCLDFASFLISDNGGEKLSFKITVLLAVTVMQLILNEILPSSSERIPLISVYCIGVFTLMLLSLLETIVLMYLLRKDSAAQDNEADKEQSPSEFCAVMKKQTCCNCVYDADETPTQVLFDKEGSNSQLLEVSHALEKVSGDLREMKKTISLINTSSGNDERKPDYRTAKINKVFCICYVTAAILFLICIFSIWNIAEDE